MNDYLTVRSNGFVTYCDGLIARITSNQAQAFLFSLVGSPAHIQATSAHFYNGGLCRISGWENEAFELGRWTGTIRSIRARKIGDIVNKVMISADHFARKGQLTDTALSAVVFGPDMDTVKNQAFFRLDNSTTMPLKPEWQEWLWDEVLHPEKLFSFGNRQLQEAWAISWQDESLEEQVLEGIRQHYLD